MLENDNREDYVRSKIERDKDGRLVVHPFPTQDSSMLPTLARADGLTRWHPFAPAAEKGEVIDAITFDSYGCFSNWLYPALRPCPPVS
jgi:molybdopterin molybdotransferase